MAKKNNKGNQKKGNSQSVWTSGDTEAQAPTEETQTQGDEMSTENQDSESPVTEEQQAPAAEEVANETTPAQEETSSLTNDGSEELAPEVGPTEPSVSEKDEEIPFEVNNENVRYLLKAIKYYAYSPHRGNYKAIETLKHLGVFKK